MILELGKLYKTRGGEIVKVVYIDQNLGFYPVKVEFVNTLGFDMWVTIEGEYNNKALRVKSTSNNDIVSTY